MLTFTPTHQPTPRPSHHRKGNTLLDPTCCICMATLERALAGSGFPNHGVPTYAGVPKGGDQNLHSTAFSLEKGKEATSARFLTVTPWREVQYAAKLGVKLRISFTLLQKSEHPMLFICRAPNPNPNPKCCTADTINIWPAYSQETVDHPLHSLRGDNQIMDAQKNNQV